MNEGERRFAVFPPVFWRGGGKVEQILTCTGLGKKFGRLPALSEVSVNMYSSRLVSLTGESGSGKSVFLRLAAGVLRPTAGELTVCGELPASREAKEVTAYLPDRDILPPDMTLTELVRYYHHFCIDFDTGLAVRLLGDICADMGRRFGKYSAGMRSAIQTILVTSRRARLFLLDEPTRCLDGDGGLMELIVGRIFALAGEDSAVIAADNAFLDTADDLLTLRCGTVSYYGSAAEGRYPKDETDA